jgi:hypothetical protein
VGEVGALEQLTPGGEVARDERIAEGRRELTESLPQDVGNGAHRGHEVGLRLVRHVHHAPLTLTLAQRGDRPAEE